MYFCSTVSHFLSVIAVVILFCFVPSVKGGFGYVGLWLGSLMPVLVLVGLFGFELCW